MDKKYPAQAYQLITTHDVLEMGHENYFARTEEFLRARCIDIENEVITRAVIEAAREEGVTFLYLLDKDFVIRALTNEFKRWEKENEKDSNSI